MSNAWEEKSVYLTALTLRGEDREAFLLGACPTPEARARIERLLKQAESGSGDGFEGKSGGEAPTSESAPAEIRTGGALPGMMLDEFWLIREIGRGGMGTVFLGEDTLLHREVAVKLLAQHLVGSERALARFRDEARNAAGLTHPSIVPVHKLGSDGDLHYIVSEYVEGMTLGRALEAERERRAKPERSGHQSWVKRAAEIVASIADALDCSHRAGILHRDVKPSNILIDKSGVARLTDFGIAKRLGPEEQILHTQAIGTCHYMSPEQASVEDARIDQRSDVFSLGAVLYELLSLRRAFDGKDASRVLKAVISEEPPGLRSIDRSIPRDLETICHKALEKSPARRYQSAAHMGADLRAFLAGLPILARPPGLARRAALFASRRRFALAAAVFLGMTLTIGLLWQRALDSRDARLAFVSVESRETPVRVLIQRCDESTLEYPRDAKEAGQTPVRNLRLAPGQYRITLATLDGGSFAEFNAVLLWPGPSNRVNVQVDSEAQGASPPVVEGKRQLRARLVPTAAAAESMIAVEPGDFVVGWSKSPDAAMKERTVRLPGFLIDRTKVSNREYDAFLKATGRTPPPQWEKCKGEDALLDLPVTNVSLEDAEAFARWRGKRLPTVFEWQAAMRGNAGWRYPTGNTLDPSMAEAEPSRDVLLAEQSWDPDALFNLYASNCPGVRAPDAFATPTGILHGFGGVRELSATIGFPRHDVVLVGRAWSDSLRHADLTRTRSTPYTGYSLKTGFRCAKSAGPPVAAP